MTALPLNIRHALSAYPGPMAAFIEADNETAVIVKADAADIAGFRGKGVAISYRYELAMYPEGSAIRLFFQIHDRPDSPFDGESFLNPASPGDLALLRKLERQDALTFHFHDMRLAYIFSKLIRHRPAQQSELAHLLTLALEHNAAIAPNEINFVAVTYRFQQEHPL